MQCVGPCRSTSNKGCPECHVLGRLWQIVSIVSTGIATAQWLGLRLQLIAAVLVTLVGVMAIAGNEDILPGFHGAGEYTASKFAMLCFAFYATNKSLSGLVAQLF